MNCPYCGHKETKVIGSIADTDKVTRRRMCVWCKERFTTVEYAAPGTFHLSTAQIDALIQTREKLLEAYSEINAILRSWKQ